jgi:hypothetical protein
MYGEFREAPTSTPTGGTSGGGSTASRRSVKRQIDASTAPMDSMPHLRDGEFFFDDLDADYATILDTMSGSNRTRRQANRQNNSNSNSNKSVELSFIGGASNVKIHFIRSGWTRANRPWRW